MSSEFITIYIDRNQKISLFRQVYEKIRDHILSGFLKPGTRLPPTRRLAKELKKKKAGYDIEFKTGIPDLNLFPRAAWGKYLKAAVMEAKDAELSYYEPEGHLGLREELSAYLYRAKGIKADPSRIVITNGATQALSLAAGVLQKEHCEAVIEDVYDSEFRYDGPDRPDEIYQRRPV